MRISETQRLILSEFSAKDAPFICELVNTPGWLAYIGDRHIANEKDAVAYLEKGPVKSYREHGFGLYLVSLKEGGIPIGMCGLIRREGLEDVDMGFAFLPQYNGKGYASEAAAEVMELAKKSGIGRIAAITMPSNESAIRLLKKLNMKFKRMVRLGNEENELMLFSVDI